MLGKWQVELDNYWLEYSLEKRPTSLIEASGSLVYTYNYWLTLAVF